MPKAGERTYFKSIGKDGIDFTLAKPFSDPNNVGSLLHDIAAVFSLLPPPPAKILDLGCGSGWTSSFYARAGYEVVGIDIAPEAVRAARQHFKQYANLSFEVGDYDSLAYYDEFDAVVFFDSLHHAEDERVALRAAYQALRPGGSIITCEPGVGHSKSPSSLEAVQKYGVNERDMPPKVLRPLLKNIGFKNIQTFAYPAITHRMLYKKRNKKIANLALWRALSAFLLASILLGNHGIVTAIKKEGNQ